MPSMQTQHIHTELSLSCTLPDGGGGKGANGTQDSLQQGLCERWEPATAPQSILALSVFLWCEHMLWAECEPGVPL